MYYYIILCLSVIYIQCTPSDLNLRVFGGKRLRFNAHQHLVLLLSHKSFCSGSIISKQWIVSAAHCFASNKYHVEVLKLSPNSTMSFIEKVDRSRITMFPGFVLGLPVYETIEKDLALLKTTKNILYDGLAKPIRLARTKPTIGQQVIVAGYGQSKYGFLIPREGSTLLTKCPGSDNLLCTNSTVRTGAGDSGGPLVFKNRLIGVTTASCNDVYENKECLSVYVDVYLNLDWIKNVTGIH